LHTQQPSLEITNLFIFHPELIKKSNLDLFEGMPVALPKHMRIKITLTKAALNSLHTLP
jgi:hypothetical protein